MSDFGSGNWAPPAITAEELATRNITDEPGMAFGNWVSNPKHPGRINKRWSAEDAILVMKKDIELLDSYPQSLKSLVKEIEKHIRAIMELRRANFLGYPDDTEIDEEGDREMEEDLYLTGYEPVSDLFTAVSGLASARNVRIKQLRGRTAEIKAAAEAMGFDEFRPVILAMIYTDPLHRYPKIIEPLTSLGIWHLWTLRDACNCQGGVSAGHGMLT